MTKENKHTNKKTSKEKQQEEFLQQYTIEKRTINGEEIEVKVYKELKKRPITNVCR